jgi:DNA polymerase-4
MFGHSRVLPWDWREGSHVKDCARLLTIKAARRMRTAHYNANRLSLLLRGPEGRWAGEQTLHHAQDDHTLLSALEGLFQRAQRQKAPHHVKKVGVILHDLVHENEIHPDLFETTQDGSGGQNKPKSHAWKTITHLMDQLRLRHGEKSLYFGQQIAPPGGYAGGKIAFNRIPDWQDFDHM